VLVNGSDNLLLNGFVDPALECTPFTAPNLADGGKRTTSLALNELQAAASQPAPVALVPLTNPMTLVDGRRSIQKTNLYRAQVDQPRLGASADRTVDSPRSYCDHLVTAAVSRLELDRDLETAASTPAPETSRNLFAFLAERLSGSFDTLHCSGLLGGMPNPVELEMDGDVVTGATFHARRCN
jgi:hypothetical protein